MDIPFCRMEIVYHNHFVEQKARPLQNGPLRPHPGNGNGDVYIYIYTLYDYISRTNMIGECSRAPELSVTI